ncbi:MAG TPA: hypothetical protein PKI93_02605 [Alphaproteobacteria bacterium]|nr:hypothetical protein [Alphaproteobacteria bacterium]HNS44577.1 hypothetical protein [Alphaproteobacteria bacterium]
MLQSTPVIDYLLELRTRFEKHSSPDGSISHMTIVVNGAEIGRETDTLMVEQTVLDLKKRGIHLTPDFNIQVCNNGHPPENDILDASHETDLIVLCNQYSPSRYDYYTFEDLLSPRHFEDGIWERLTERMGAQIVSIQGNKTISSRFMQKGTLHQLERHSGREGFTLVADKHLDQFSQLEVVKEFAGRKYYDVPAAITKEM